MDGTEVTSKFYQRYLQNLKLGEKKQNEENAGNQTTGNNARAVDPTAMLSVPSSGDNSKDQKQRRVQIMNKSDDFNPDAKLSDLPKYKKSDESKAFLQESLSQHYLFEALAKDDLENIIDCMRPYEASKGDFIVRDY